MPTLAAGDDARLLWYTNHAHGSGPAYNVVTVTAVRDGTAWQRLALRIQKGDLQTWMRDLDEGRDDVDAKLLVPLPWSPLKDVDFNDVPTDGREHELTLYMEDTMWPYEDKFIEYIDRSGEVYAKSLDRPNPLLTHRGRLPAGARQPPAARSRLDAAHPRLRSALLRLLQTEIPLRAPWPGEPGCTTLLSCAISGPAGCCGPPRGHHCAEARMNIGTIIDAAAAADPARAALIIDGRRIGYGELATAVERCAAHLAASGATGRRIAVVDVGSLLSIATMFGAARIGAAAALMNPALTPSELQGLVANAGCAACRRRGRGLRRPAPRRGLARRYSRPPTCSTTVPARAPTRRRHRRPRSPGPVHQRNDRAPEGDRHHQGQMSARITGVTTRFRATRPS